jgi:hypothetical protein
MVKLARAAWAAGATIAIAVACTTGGTAPGGWDHPGWFASPTKTAADSATDEDAGLPGMPGAGGSSSGAPNTNACGTCNVNEICVGMPGGPACAATCIEASQCGTGCCVTVADKTGKIVSFCAPQTSCCGNSGSNCKESQVCAKLPNGEATCANACNTSIDCTDTVCCYSTHDAGPGACVSMSAANFKCRY